MEHSEKLKTLLQDLIHDRQEQAEASMHDYFVAKTREVSGLGAAVEPVEVTELDDENDE